MLQGKSKKRKKDKAEGTRSKAVAVELSRGLTGANEALARRMKVDTQKVPEAPLQLSRLSCWLCIRLRR